MGHFKHFFLAVVAIAMTGSLTTSCSSESSEDGSETTDVGTYKVEVSLSGDTGRFTPAVLFSGVDKSLEAATIYDMNGGSHFGEYAINGSDAPFTGAAAYTSATCLYFYTSLMFYNHLSQEGSVTVLCRGYFNGKLAKTSERTFLLAKNDVVLMASFDVVDGLRLISDSHE